MNLERAKGTDADPMIRKLVMEKTRIGTSVPPLVFRLCGEDRFELCKDPDGYETANLHAACVEALKMMPVGIHRREAIHVALMAQGYTERTIDRALQSQPAGVRRIGRGVYSIGAVELPGAPVGEFKESWPEDRPPFAP